MTELIPQAGCPLCAAKLCCLKVDEHPPNFSQRLHYSCRFECSGCYATFTIVAEQICLSTPAIVAYRESEARDKDRAKAIREAQAEVVRLVEAAPDPITLTPELMAARDRLRALRGAT